MAPDQESHSHRTPNGLLVALGAIPHVPGGGHPSPGLFATTLQMPPPQRVQQSGA